MTARHVRHSLYRIYQELHPEFEIPDEVFTARIADTTTEEQYISQKIMKSGMAAAASALRQEQEHEEKRRKVSQEAPAKASFDRLRAHNTKDSDISSSRNQGYSSASEKTKQSGSNSPDRQKVSTAAEKQKITGTTNKLTKSGRQSRESITEAASQMRSVRDLKPVDKRNPIERLFGWLGGLVRK